MRLRVEPEAVGWRPSCMLSRREVLQGIVWAGAGAVCPAALVACGNGSAGGSTTTGGPTTTFGATGLAVSGVARDTGEPASRAGVVRAVQVFTGDLFNRLAVSPGNLVCSPYSVAVALAMTRNGARGQTAQEMDRVLHAPTLEELNGGLNSLTRLVEGRAGEQLRADGSKATIALDVANSLWGQRDTRWRQGFLDVLSRHHGAGMHLVDYRRDPEVSRLMINRWTSDQTQGKISELLPEGVLNAMTRLVLVNAIYLKAPWEEPFEKRATSRRPFVRADGVRVQVEMMSNDLRKGEFVSGRGWQAGRLRYAGRKLGMAVVVPDPGKTSMVQDLLGGAGLAQILAGFKPAALRLQIPRWRFRRQTPLNDHLAALGMPTVFDADKADLSGMTAQERLFISRVQHEAMIAVDEAGTEAAAATAVVVQAVSGGGRTSSVVLTADRPFFFIVHDIETAMPLFIGRVSDPTIRVQ
jgi:serine protease inhibitor